MYSKVEFCILAFDRGICFTYPMCTQLNKHLEDSNKYWTREVEVKVSLLPRNKPDRSNFVGFFVWYLFCHLSNNL
jgi:hypothetical protein